MAWTASGYRHPISFLGVGGHKLFRDRIWSDLRFVFQADHRRYRATGSYDFPQGQINLRVINQFRPTNPSAVHPQAILPAYYEEFGSALPARGENGIGSDHLEGQIALVTIDA